MDDPIKDDGPRGVIARALRDVVNNIDNNGMDADAIIMALHAGGFKIVPLPSVSEPSEAAIIESLRSAYRMLDDETVGLHNKIDALERSLISCAVVGGELGKMLLRGDG